ncbi:MAG TPA: hypothetical protein VGD67_11925 [Pseudonocardiaceae bacterium]
MTRWGAVDFDRLCEVFPSGVASRAALLGLGIASSTLAQRCRPGGPWRRLIPGVFLVTGGTPTREQLVRGALSHAGPGAVVTGIEALRRHGVRRLPSDDTVHVLIPHARHVRGRSYVVIERTIRPPAATGAIPLASPARALIDAARRMSRPDEVRAMVSDAIQRRICRLGELEAELAAATMVGTALIRRALKEIGRGVRSVAESWGMALLRRSRLPDPEWNVALYRQNRLLAVVDAWWDDVGVAWEIDSHEYHLGPADHERTTRRRAALAAAGVIVVPTQPSRLRTEPLIVLRELADALASAAHRRRPDVHAALHRPAA